MTNLFSDIERIKLIHVAEDGFSIQTSGEFSAWIDGPVKEFFPHEKMVCVIVKILGDEVHIKPLISVNYPTECLESLAKVKNVMDCEVIRRWLSEYRAQIIDGNDIITARPSMKGFGTFCRCLANMAAFGCIDKDGQGGTYFSFSGIPGPVTRHHGYLLELLVPYLHQALTRISHKNRIRVPGSADPSRRLTKREQQILSMIATGMTNRAIAENLSRSELTVQNHVQAIFRKLGVTNRATAVALIGNVI